MLWFVVADLLCLCSVLDRGSPPSPTDSCRVLIRMAMFATPRDLPDELLPYSGKLSDRFYEVRQNVAEFCQEIKVRHALCLSCACVCDSPDLGPVTESCDRCDVTGGLWCVKSCVQVYWQKSLGHTGGHARVYGT